MEVVCHITRDTSQSIKNTLGLAPSGRSSPLYEALTNAEIKSERSAKKTAAVIERILEVRAIVHVVVLSTACLQSAAIVNACTTFAQPAKARAAGLREPVTARGQSVLDGDRGWWNNLVSSVTGRRDPLDGRLDRIDRRDEERRDERREDRRDERREDRRDERRMDASRDARAMRDMRRRDMLVDDDDEVDAVQWTVMVAAAVALPTVVASEYTINATCTRLCFPCSVPC